MIRQLFDRYQSQLLTFVNTDRGREFLLDQYGGVAGRNEPIVHVSPDGFHVLKDIVKDTAIIQATFFSKSPYIRKFSEMLTYIDIAAQYENIHRYSAHDISDLPRRIYLTTTTFNPDANPESTSVDGVILRNGINETWAQIHDTTSGTNVDDSSTSNTIVSIVDSGTSNKWQTLNRAMFLFDTSSLTSSASISAATFQVYVSAKADHHSQTVQLVSANPASNTSLATSDYDTAKFGTSASLYATGITIASLSTSAYNTWTLNGTGLAALSKTGVSKLGVILSGDAANTEPTYIGAGNGDTVDANMADNASNKPQLTVTYTISTGGGFLLNFL